MRLFSKKVYPEVWNKYINSFSSKKKIFSELRFVVFDTETTGLNPLEDRILSIGAVGIAHKNIDLKDIFECFFVQDKFSRETVEIHGIRKTTEDKIPEKEAVLNFLTYIQDAILVGHHINFDVAMINQALHRLGLPKLKNTMLDTGNLHLKTYVDLPQKKHFSLDELADLYHIPMHDRHNASGDAFITAQLLIKIFNKLEKTNPLSISYLKRPVKRIGLL